MPSKEKEKKIGIKPPLRSNYTKQFKKDFQRLARSGRYDMALLKNVMQLLIANKGPLPENYKDHALSGDMKDHRECHVRGDFLLIYNITPDGIIFSRTGSHAELF